MAMLSSLRTVSLGILKTTVSKRTTVSVSVLQPSSTSDFRFTLDNPILSTEQRQHYEDNGFVIIRSLFKSTELERYAKRFEDIACGKVKVLGLTVMRDVSLRDVKNPDVYVVNKIQDLMLDDELFEYCTYPKILDHVAAFIGPNQMAVTSMLINKPPDSGSLTSRHPLHQDLHYFPFRPAHKVVCSWTALEKVTRLNGCLVGIPESHKGELLVHTYPEWQGGVNKAYHGIQDYEKVIGKRVFFEMEAGDTVFFHPLLIHGSGANRTKGFRKAISCHYAAAECEYIDVRGTIQDSVANEVVEMIRKRGLPIEDYTDYWKWKARLVRGKDINL